ncbi:MAG: hypothetical protein ACK4SZ_16205 [Allosphingosinicella sp.]|uniref:hypothetical protein n=1 Tax=Allosphingosinicella sp. TaxID=2823234 RepID=UPI00392501FC
MIPTGRIALMAALLAGCSQPAEHSLVIGSEHYAFPAAHVLSLETDDHLFIRLKPPETQFSLVHDSRTEGQRDPRGMPVIFSVSDGENPRLQYREAGGQTMVCRVTANQRGGCGLVLREGGATWAILVPSPVHAETAVADARSVLRSYRTR